MPQHHVAVGLKAAGCQDNGVGAHHLRGVPGRNDEPAQEPVRRDDKALCRAPILNGDAMALCRPRQRTDDGPAAADGLNPHRTGAQIVAG